MENNTDSLVKEAETQSSVTEPEKIIPLGGSLLDLPMHSGKVPIPFQRMNEPRRHAGNALAVGRLLPILSEPTLV